MLITKVFVRVNTVPLCRATNSHTAILIENNKMKSIGANLISHSHLAIVYCSVQTVVIFCFMGALKT